MDTQWPRFQVFVQQAPNEAHQDYGSVHAPDAEIALLNARDVFARRPECFSMWVVPAEAIYAVTREQLEVDGSQPGSAQTGARTDTLEEYFIFIKARAAGTHVLHGVMRADSPQAALEKAVQSWQGKRRPLVWWVVPACLVLQSDPGDVDSLYAPAREKTFRLSSDFHTVTAMRQIKLGEPEPEPPSEEDR